MSRRPGSRSWRFDLPSHEALEGLTDQQRLEIVERLNVHVSRHPAIRAMIVLVAMLSVIAGALLHGPIAAGLQSLGLWRIPSRIIGASLVSLATVAMGMTIGYWLLWSICSRAFRRAMCEMGRDVCLECGYWLRGLGDEVSRCPECGGARARADAAYRG